MHVALRSSALLATFQRASLCPGVLPNPPQVVRNAEIQLQFGACLWMPWPVPPQLLRHTNGGCIPTGFGRGMGFASHQVIQCSMDSMLLALRPLDEPGGSCKSKRSCDCALSIFLVQKVESFFLFWSHVSLFHFSFFCFLSFRLMELNSASGLLRIVGDRHKHKLVGAASSGTPSFSTAGVDPRKPEHLAKNLHPWTSSNPLKLHIIYEFHSYITDIENHTYTNIASSSMGQNGTHRPQVGYNLDKLWQFWSQELPAMHGPSFRSSFTSEKRRLVLRLIYVCSSNSFGFSMLCASNLRIKRRIYQNLIEGSCSWLNFTKWLTATMDEVFLGRVCGWCFPWSWLQFEKRSTILPSFETSFGTRWKMFDLWRVCVMLTTNGPKWPNGTMKATEYKSVKLNVEISVTLEYQSIHINTDH